MPQRTGIGIHARQPLLYAAAFPANVYVYSYPGGTKLGQLSGFDSKFNVGGLCADNSGNVFVSGHLSEWPFHGQAYEFASGGTTPIAKFDERYQAVGCAVDSTTGNLVVANLNCGGHTAGSVAIFSKRHSKPRYYCNNLDISFGFCAYDDAGNLFLSLWPYPAGGMIELPKGSKSFIKLKVSNNGFVRSVQWYDGKLVLSSYQKHIDDVEIEAVKVKNDVLEVLKTTTLVGGRRHLPSSSQFWIDDAHIVGAGNDLRGLFIWNYPVGGKPHKTLNGDAYWEGVTVSLSS